MKVKLTWREPTAESFNEAQRWTGDPRIRRALIAAHDAAPDEATKALGRALRTLYRIAQWDEVNPSPHQQAARDAWHDVCATPEGRALLED